MKFRVIKKASVEKSKKVFKETTGRIDKDRHTDNMLEYQLLDDEFNDVFIESKSFVEDAKGNPKKVITKEPVIYSQHRINSLKKMGQLIEIVDMKKVNAEKEAFAKALKEAEIRGYEKAKKELSK